MELLVALTLGAVVLAMVGGVSVRQQHFYRAVVASTERTERLDQATALIPVAIRSIAPGEGDIPPGGARDTALEFRATIATAVVCDSGHGSLVLAPVRAEPPQLASILQRPDAGDTLWALLTSGADESWAPRPITAVFDSVTTCLIGGLPPWKAPVGQPSLVIRVVGPLPAGQGTPVRITRLWKYSLYRASDGDWYLGARDWNSGAMRFNIIQPVSGPFTSAARHGMALRYYDSTGAVVASGAADPRGIAFIQVAFSVDSGLAGGLGWTVGLRTASTTSIALRNHRR
jgi:hypothetical protein